MVTKSCIKILILPKILPTRFCLWGKNLVDGEMLCLGIISAYLYIMLFYAGEIQNSNKLPKTGNGDVFFPNKRVRFARRADKAVALQYHNQ